MSIANQANMLLNRALPLDSTMIMNILIELLNSKPLKCLVIPDFRIDQLIKLAMKRVTPVSEKKLLETVCSSYCLCLYFALTTNYTKGHTFRFLAMLQNLQAETLVSISNFGAGNKIQMPDIFLSLQKDEAIDVNYKLETFSDSLTIAKLICRDLYALMKIVFRVGRRGARTASFTPDEKRRQLKYTECVQPQSLYFMCTFAYAHIAVVLHASSNLNVYPGMMESVLLMTLTTTPAVCNAVVAKTMPTDSQSPDSIIQETQRAAQEAHAQRQSAHTGPTEGESEAAKPVVAMKLGYDLLMESAHRLAVFVAHIVCDDRSLQEARLAHGRLFRHFNHPNIVFAQFRTSGVKALLALDRPRKADQAQPAMARTVLANSAPSARANATMNASVSGVLSPLQKLKQKHGNVRVASAVDNKPSHATSSAIVDINKLGYHMLNKASRPADWQVQDPLEQDLDSAVGSPKSPKSPNNRLSAARLSALGTMTSPLPSLALSGRAPMSPSRRNHPRTPSDRNTSRAGGQGGKYAGESISELPLPSSRTGRDTASRGGPRSARAPKSSRSLSSDGGGSDTSDSSSHRASSRGDSSSQVSQKMANPFVLMSKQPNLISQFRRTHTSTTVADGAVVNMDQLIAGYWALNKIYRPMFVVFDALHSYPEYQLYFPEEYQPAPFEIRSEEDLTKLSPALSTRAVHEACKVIESQYFHLSAAVRLPRILDPTQDVYWICNYLIDYLAKQTTHGQGFHPSTATELNTLKKRFKTLRLQHTTATSAASDKHYRSLPQLPTNTNTHKTTSARTTQNVNTTLSNVGEGTSPLKGPRAALNLQDRLAAAAVEASMESKLFSMEKKMHAEKQVLHDAWTHDSASQSVRPRFLSDFSEPDAPAAAGLEEAVSDSTPSVVWTCVPKQAYQAAVMFTGHDDDDDDEMDTNPFTERIPKKIAAEYAKKILEKQREQAEQEMQHKQYLADQAENIIAKNRAAKAERIRAIREQTKEELMNKSKFKNEWEQLQRKQLAVDKAKARLEAKEKEDNALKEIMRVKEVKLIHENRMRQAEMERQTALKREAEKIQMLTSADEVAYINRQNQEEARMKFLEERRRVIEDKLVAAAEVKKAKLARKQARTADVRDHMQSRVRMGTFKYHNGQFGFYDAVRAAPVEWVQYEDADGNPYYYDPISQQSQYRVPVDADIHHYTEDERREYDSVHGEGAYDAYMADKAFKDGVNQNGGYYNEKGLWIEMDGYYDENYNWVPNEGYYDENGRYRKYAKVCGDLSFMV